MTMRIVPPSLLTTLLMLAAQWALATTPGAAPSAPASDADREARIAAVHARLEADARELAELHVQGLPGAGLPPGAPGMMMFGGSRTLLGIVPAAVAGQGVKVVSVLPGSGAASAGLKSGDVIIAVRGQAVAGGEPVRQLTRAMSGTKPGERVEVRYLRDGAQQVAQVQTSDATSGLHLQHGPHVLPMGENAMFNLPLPGGLQMAAMTPGLGRYFGTDSGVLVVGGAGNEGDGLQDGDVIVRIAGEPVRNVEDVFPRLIKPGSEERIELQVMREHTLQTVHAAPLPPPQMFFRNLHEPH